MRGLQARPEQRLSVDGALGLVSGKENIVYAWNSLNQV